MLLIINKQDIVCHHHRMSFLQPACWLGLEEKNWAPGSADWSTNSPSISSVFRDDRSHIGPCTIRAPFPTALRKGHRVWKRCVLCPAAVSFPDVIKGKGEGFV